MHPLDQAKSHAVGFADVVDRAEAQLLTIEQADCPVAHHFGPGVYMRELTMRAGTLAIGHYQKHPHLNVMLSGRVSVIGESGEPTELAAPLTFTGQPGRKVGLVLADVVWLNVYPNPNDERDIDTLEAMWLDKSDTWKAADEARKAVTQAASAADRADYAVMLAQYGFDQATGRAQTENTRDQCAMPDGWARVTIRPSCIEGLGVFLTSPAEAGETLAPGLIDGLRTPAGRYTNHSANPNAAMVLREPGRIDLVATRRINGCHGGDQGEEVTVDYRQVLELRRSIQLEMEGSK